jgi:ERF superfamily
MERSTEIQELAKALSLAQGEMGAAKMDSVNPFYKSKYANLGSVIESIKVPLKNHGLSISQFTEGDGTNVTLTTVLMHESGQWLSSTVSLPLPPDSKNIAQQLGIISTYLRRYGLSAILSVYTEEDTDGNDVGKDSKAEDKSKSTKSSKTPEPVTEEVLAKQKEVIELCKNRGGQNNKDLMTILEKHLDGKHDPSKLGDMAKLDELIKEISVLPEYKEEKK